MTGKSETIYGLSRRRRPLWTGARGEDDDGRHVDYFQSKGPFTCVIVKSRKTAP